MPNRPVGRSYDEVEAELRRQPEIADCAVIRVSIGQGETRLLAFAVMAGDRGQAPQPQPPDDLLERLSKRLPGDRVPDAVVALRSLPRTADGAVAYDELPRPAWRGGRTVQGKGLVYGSHTGSSGAAAGCALTAGALVVAAAAFALTDVLWPGSTDLTGVPQPWAALFLGLYGAECLSFGCGVVLLFSAWALASRGGSWRMPVPVLLAIVWLLAAWWPQDNFYRLAAKTDWPRQAALVYAFNITLMIAAGVVAVFAGRRRDRTSQDD